MLCMSWYVYILECKDESLYTGITNDVEKRMEAHRKGVGSKYVRSKGFGRLLYSISVADKSSALKMEYKVKQMERNDKISYFVANGVGRN